MTLSPDAPGMAHATSPANPGSAAPLHAADVVCAPSGVIDDLAAHRAAHALRIQLAATSALLAAPECVCGRAHPTNERLACLRAIAGTEAP